MTADPPPPEQPPPALVLESVVHDVAWPKAFAAASFLAAIAAGVAHHLEAASPEYAVIAFSDDARVQALNLQYLGKDKPTNVLSFPAFAPSHPGGEHPAATATIGVPATFLGDIILARETVCREAAEQGCSLEHHTTHLIVHGILHLMGYDHDGADAAEAMEALEIDILAGLGIANPYTEELVDAG